MSQERNADPRTQEIQSLCSVLCRLPAFVTIRGQPGSSLSQSPQPDSWTYIFSFSFHLPEPQKWPSSQLYNLHWMRKRFSTEPGKFCSPRLDTGQKKGGELLMYGLLLALPPLSPSSLPPLTHTWQDLSTVLEKREWSPFQHSQKDSSGHVLLGLSKN